MSMERQTTITEEANDNIDVNTTSGLELFIERVKEDYEELLLIAKENSSSAVKSALAKADQVYDDLHEYTKHCLALKQKEAELTDDDIATLQSGYNQLLDIIDSLADLDEESVSPIEDVKRDELAETGAEEIQVASPVEETTPETLPEPVPAVAVSEAAEEIALPRFLFGTTEVDEAKVTDEIKIPIVVVPKKTEGSEEKPATTSSQEIKQIHHAPIAPRQDLGERAPRGEFGKIIDRVLKNPQYRRCVENNYSSLAHFEVVLRREIERIETTPLKGFHQALKFKFKSAFDTFVRDMTVEEMLTFDAMSHHLKVQTLNEKNIKYEVFVEWYSRLEYMKYLTHAPNHATVGEMFVRTEIEELLEKEHQLAA